MVRVKRQFCHCTAKKIHVVTCSLSVLFHFSANIWLRVDPCGQLVPPAGGFQCLSSPQPPLPCSFMHQLLGCPALGVLAASFNGA